jgi:hypothetical protein
LNSKVYNIIREIGEIVPGNIIKGYSFDWDDNILFMPTKIKVDKKVGKGWEPIRVSTEEFATIRDNPTYKMREDSFDEFRDHEGFLKDTIEAIKTKNFGPSFLKFKESLISVSPFSIITARGNSPITLKEGVKIIIDMSFSEEEKDKMVENIRMKYPSKKNLTDYDIIEFYLGENNYMPVSSDEFLSKHPNKASAQYPEIGKKIALNDYVKRVVDGASKLTNNQYGRLTIGFSDDDKKNIEAVIEYIEEELNDRYPEVDFIIYDTSDKGLNRIVVEKS